MPKTTKEIILNAYENGNLLEANKHILSTKFDFNIGNDKWFSEFEVDELKGELKKELIPLGILPEHIDSVFDEVTKK